MPDEQGVYAIICVPSGQRYVGSSRSVKTRLANHRTLLRHGRHYCLPLQMAWRLYGEDALTFTVLEAVGDVSELASREAHWMAALGARQLGKGLNVRAPRAGLKCDARLPDADEPTPTAALVSIEEDPKRGVAALDDGDLSSRAPLPSTFEQLAMLRQHFAQALAALQADAADMQVASRRGDSAWSVACAQRILSAAAALQAALSAFGEIETLKHPEGALRLGPVELGDLLMSMLARWKPLAPSHAFELALPGELPAITADAQHVERALDILLAAAVALSPAGGTIHVHIRPHADEIRVSIQQYGRTLSSSELEEVFAPFFCPPDVPFGLADGGLGPALAAAIVAAHGGRLWAEPASSGPGCSFHVVWPLVPSALSRALDVAVPASQQATAEADARLAPSRQRQVALVVDGDYRMLRYLRANLDARRYRTVVAGEMDEALRLIDLEEPDVIVLASEGAQGAGIEALRLLKGRTLAPVIVLARRYDADECVQLLDLGAADYLVKPFHLDELCARLRLALRPQATASSGQAQEPVFCSGELTIDFGQRAVAIGGRPVGLSRTEFKLLRELALHAGMVMSHEQLLERVWGPAYTHEVEFVWVYIRRLRRKIEPEPRAPRYILTVPGVGYRLARI